MTRRKPGVRSRDGLPSFIHHAKSAPPLGPLRRVVARLDAAGVVAALGGSGLLAALGLADRVGDWDLTTEAPAEQVVSALAGEPMTLHGPDGLHADHKLVLAGGRVELIAGFGFRLGSGVVRIPTEVTRRVRGIPLGSPESWAVAYQLMGREEKAEALFAYLARHGVRADIVARLLRETLPAPLVDRLAALPRREPV